MSNWCVSHRLSSAYFPLFNLKADMIVKTMKRLVSKNMNKEWLLGFWRSGCGSATIFQYPWQRPGVDSSKQSCLPRISEMQYLSSECWQHRLGSWHWLLDTFLNRRILLLRPRFSGSWHWFPRSGSEHTWQQVGFVLDCGGALRGQLLPCSDIWQGRVT